MSAAAPHARRRRGRAPFNERYAALATALEEEKEDASNGRVADINKLAMLRTAKNDARNYAVFGDPALRLASIPSMSKAHDCPSHLAPTGVPPLIANQ